MRSLAFIVFLAVSLIACGEKQEGPSEEPPEPQDSLLGTYSVDMAFSKNTCTPDTEPFEDSWQFFEGEGGNVLLLAGYATNDDFALIGVVKDNGTIDFVRVVEGDAGFYLYHLEYVAQIVASKDNLSFTGFLNLHYQDEVGDDCVVEYSFSGTK